MAFPIPRFCRYSLSSSSRSFIVLALMYGLASIWNWFLCILWGKGDSIVFSHMDSTLSFPCYCQESNISLSVVVFLGCLFCSISPCTDNHTVFFTQFYLKFWFSVEQVLPPGCPLREFWLFLALCTFIWILVSCYFLHTTHNTHSCRKPVEILVWLAWDL